MDEAQRVFGETGVAASVGSACHASPDELAALADRVWARVGELRAAPPPAGPNGAGLGRSGASNAGLLAAVQEEFRDFNASFPLVVRWMVDAGEYQPQAFRKFLRHYGRAQPRSVEDFLGLQADYLVCLFRARDRRADGREVREFRASIVAQLVEEHRAFERLQAEAEAEAAARRAAVDQERRREVHRLLLAKLAAERGEPPARR